MLWELFTLLRNRGSRYARLLGHDREAVSIAARHRRCHEAWAPHLAATKDLILTAATTAPGENTAVVLGSGLCLDVPVAELSRRFATVYLLDAHHPRSSRKLASRLGNVRLVEADLTGMAHTAERVCQARETLPSPPPQPEILAEVVPDFVASVNLASQLPIPFYKILGDCVSKPDLEAFCRGIVEAHFRWLARQPGRVCLICDAAWQRADGGKILESRDALEGVILPPPDTTWTWRIAPRPEESFSYDRQNLIWAYRDFAASGGFPVSDTASEVPAAGQGPKDRRG